MPANQSVEYEAGNLPYQDEGFRESLLDAALNAGVDLRHLCGGICACITCHVLIESGDENLSPMEKDEEDRLYRTPNLSVHSRLACRAVVRGDVVARVPSAGTKANSGERQIWPISPPTSILLCVYSMKSLLYAGTIINGFFQGG